MQPVFQPFFAVHSRNDSADDRVTGLNILLQTSHKVVGKRLYQFLSPLAGFVNDGHFPSRDAFQNTNAPSLPGFTAKLGSAQNRGVLGRFGVFSIRCIWITMRGTSNSTGIEQQV
jgi:hypothetical protein